MCGLRLKPLLYSAVTALLVFAIFIKPSSLLKNYDEAITNYKTRVGQIETNRLPDGSIVHLNTNSEIQVAFTNKTRKIILIRGESHFNVTKDPDRPFQVYAGGKMVKAVGTAFSVRLDKSAVSVVVDEGIVEIATKKSMNSYSIRETDGESSEARIGKVPDDAFLTIGVVNRGQSAEIPIATPTTISETAQRKTLSVINSLTEAEVGRRQSWKEGYLVFVGEPLNEVIDEVNRYSAAHIEITDDAISQIPIGGRFKVGNFEALFGVLEENFGVTVAHSSNGNIELSPTIH